MEDINELMGMIGFLGLMFSVFLMLIKNEITFFISLLSFLISFILALFFGVYKKGFIEKNVEE